MVVVVKYYNCDIVLADVPGEISLAFSIAGCQLACKGCFWQSLQDAPRFELSDELFSAKLESYAGLVSCVLFYGGEWEADELISKLKIARSLGLKTCLYSGRQIVANEICEQLDFIKTGGYREDLGGLSTPTTNQKFINLTTGENLTHLFWQILPTSRKSA
jgi:anaerobic ribonucleoside-triphosphate reductase activating protein